MSKEKIIKAKTNKVEGLKGEALPNEVNEEKKSNLIDNDLTADFNQFEKTVSDFTPEQKEVPTNNVSNDSGGTTSSTTEKEEDPIVKQLKLKMLVGLVCTVLVGVNNKLLNIIKGSNVPFKEMELDETEKESLIPYLDSPEILAFLDKIPAWLMGVIHFEYMMFQKHGDLSDEYSKKPKKNKEVTDVG